MQRFIIGTGRCGSTLLSTLLAEHPDALVLSEFFGGLDVVNGLRDGLVSGAELAAILLQDHEISNLNRKVHEKDREVLLDVRRYDTTRIPAIMLACLPALTDDSESLMREIVGWAKARPSTTLGEHYPALFDWLTGLFKKTFWIERSGASSEFFPGLRKLFPDARYLHITREGTEAALSMYNMKHFVTQVSFWHDPPSVKDIEDAIRGSNEPGDDIISRRHRQRPTPAVFGKFWTHSVCLLLSEVQYLDREQYREFRFEDMHGDSVSFLGKVAEYFQISADGDWIERAVKKIRDERHDRFSELSEEEQSALLEAIHPGQVLLKRSGLERPNQSLYRQIRDIWDSVDPRKAVQY